MIYVYDDAIVKDLQKSFNPLNSDDPVVKIVDPEAIIGLAAQIKEDQITFPVIALSREGSIQIDKSRMNFTRLHKGVQAVLEEHTNNLYYEKAVPIDLKYTLTVLTTNTADMDELVRELIFKYVDMYFLTVTLPYEAKRKVRIGLTIDPDSSIDRQSGASEYIKNGQLYQTIISLKCEGAVLVTYTPAHLRREVHEVTAVTHAQAEDLNLI